MKLGYLLIFLAVSSTAFGELVCDTVGCLQEHITASCNDQGMFDCQVSCTIDQTVNLIPDHCNVTIMSGSNHCDLSFSLTNTNNSALLIRQWNKENLVDIAVMDYMHLSGNLDSNFSKFQIEDSKVSLTPLVGGQTATIVIGSLTLIDSEIILTNHLILMVKEYANLTKSSYTPTSSSLVNGLTGYKNTSSILARNSTLELTLLTNWRDIQLDEVELRSASLILNSKNTTTLHNCHIAADDYQIRIDDLSISNTTFSSKSELPTMTSELPLSISATSLNISDAIFEIPTMLVGELSLADTDFHESVMIFLDQGEVDDYRFENVRFRQSFEIHHTEYSSKPLRLIHCHFAEHYGVFVTPFLDLVFSEMQVEDALPLISIASRGLSLSNTNFHDIVADTLFLATEVGHVFVSNVTITNSTMDHLVIADFRNVHTTRNIVSMQIDQLFISHVDTESLFVVLNIVSMNSFTLRCTMTNSNVNYLFGSDGSLFRADIAPSDLIVMNNMDLRFILNNISVNVLDTTGRGGFFRISAHHASVTMQMDYITAYELHANVFGSFFAITAANVVMKFGGALEASGSSIAGRGCDFGVVRARHATIEIDVPEALFQEFYTTGMGGWLCAMPLTGGVWEDDTELSLEIYFHNTVTFLNCYATLGSIVYSQFDINTLHIESLHITDGLASSQGMFYMSNVTLNSISAIEHGHLYVDSAESAIVFSYDNARPTIDFGGVIVHATGVQSVYASTTHAINCLTGTLPADDRNPFILSCNRQVNDHYFSLNDARFDVESGDISLEITTSASSGLDLISSGKWSHATDLSSIELVIGVIHNRNKSSFTLQLPDTFVTIRDIIEIEVNISTCPGGSRYNIYDSDGHFVCVECETNYFTYLANASECGACPPHASCAYGELTLFPGYWYEPETGITRCHACDGGLFVKGDESAVCAGFATGHHCHNCLETTSDGSDVFKIGFPETVCDDCRYPFLSFCGYLLTLIGIGYVLFNVGIPKVAEKVHSELPFLGEFILSQFEVLFGLPYPFTTHSSIYLFLLGRWAGDIMDFFFLEWTDIHSIRCVMRLQFSYSVEAMFYFSLVLIVLLSLQIYDIYVSGAHKTQHWSQHVAAFLIAPFLHCYVLTLSAHISTFVKIFVTCVTSFVSLQVVLLLVRSFRTTDNHEGHHGPSPYEQLMLILVRVVVSSYLALTENIQGALLICSALNICACFCWIFFNIHQSRRILVVGTSLWAMVFTGFFLAGSLLHVNGTSDVRFSVITTILVLLASLVMFQLIPMKHKHHRKGKKKPNPDGYIQIQA